MAEFPALPLFTDAYLADTIHLTTEEHGAYLLLLMCAWRTRGCSLRDDDRFLARIAGVSSSKWRRMRPDLVAFFSVEDGFWRQKKLSHVYDTVSKKVARNRLNGAKGGRAKVRRVKNGEYSAKPLITSPIPQANATFSPGWPQVFSPTSAISDGGDVGLATKTKTKFESCSSLVQSSGDLGGIVTDEDLAAIATAAALFENSLDVSVIAGWVAAGALLALDILPTIARLRAREETRVGQPPRHLRYYNSAVLEERDKRVGAQAEGVLHAQLRPERTPAVPFKVECVQAWRQFLGDVKSRFRGEHLSRNWQIPKDHPVFLPAELGPDPCHRPNAKIPQEIYDEYGIGWGWRPRPTATASHDGSNNTATQSTQSEGDSDDPSH